MSEDIPSKDPSGGFIMPRRLPLAVVVAIIVATFGLGGWAATLQITQNEHSEKISQSEERWRRVERYMCLSCAADKTVDCSDICGMRRWRSK